MNTKDNNNEIIFKSMDTNSYIYKSHNLIESSYNLTLNEQRLLYLGAKKLKPRYIESNIRPSDLKTVLAHETFKDLKIYVSEFKDIFNVNSKNIYQVLSDTAKSLYEKSIQYMENDGTFVEKRWVITCKYNNNDKSVELTFHPDLVLDLLVLKGKYGRMQFEPVKKFTSTYAFRLYELLQNYSYQGKREIQLEDLRYKLGIYDEEKYKRYTDFNKRILQPSIELINTHTDINVEYESKRYGRSIGSIKFYISKNNKFNLIDTSENDVIDEKQIMHIQQIVNKSITPSQAGILIDLTLTAIKEHNVDMSFYEYIQQKVDCINEYNKHNDIKSYIGILYTAIKENWQMNQTKEKQKLLNFNNFEAREYNYDELERKLLKWD